MSVVIGVALICQWLRLVGLVSTPPCCIVVDALLMGASWSSMAQAMPGFGPLCSEQCAGLDRAPGCLLHRLPELPGALENIYCISGPLVFLSFTCSDTRDPLVD